MEEKQQLVRLRQHRLLQRQQQHDEPGGAERRPVGVLGTESDVDLAGGASEADQAEEPDRESANERLLARLLLVDHGAGYSRIRHAQAQVQVLLLL